jgi:hypothetical protein
LQFTPSDDTFTKQPRLVVCDINYGRRLFCPRGTAVND